MCVVCEHMYEQARVCGDPHTHTRCMFGLVCLHVCVVRSILFRSEIKSCIWVQNAVRVTTQINSELQSAHIASLTESMLFAT